MTPTDEELKLFEEITQLPGIAGQEKAVRSHMTRMMEPYADELLFDGLGSCFALKRSKNPMAPRVMVAAHMDETGFIVKGVTSKGLLKIHPIGGWAPAVLQAQRVRVYPRFGEEPLCGVISSTPPHLLSEESRKNTIPPEDLLVDIGASEKEEVASAGIVVGDPIILDGAFSPLMGGKKLIAKAWDDRLGCVLAIELLKALKDHLPEADFYIGATVQEEIGLKGGRTAANMIKPDIALILEASPADDLFGNDGLGIQGNGVLVRFLDRTHIANRELYDLALSLCKEKNIPFQPYLSKGGTDAGEIITSHSGCAGLVIGAATRYIHTSGSILDYSDYCATRSLALSLCRSLTQEKIEMIKEYSR